MVNRKENLTIIGNLNTDIGRKGRNRKKGRKRRKERNKEVDSDLVKRIKEDQDLLNLEFTDYICNYYNHTFFYKSITDRRLYYCVEIDKNKTNPWCDNDSDQNIETQKEINDSSEKQMR